MALVTTAGSATAEAYADVTFADAYFATTPRDAEWTAVGNDATKEIYLREGMMILEEFAFLGSRSNPIAGVLQALEYPRRSSHYLGIAPVPAGSDTWTDLRGREWTSAAIPTPIKEAHCEAALVIYQNPTMLAPQGEVKSVRTGVVSMQLDGEGKSDLLGIVTRKLRPFLALSSGGGTTLRN